MVLSEARGHHGGAWLEDGSIIFSGGATRPLLRIPESGGTPQVVTAGDPRESAAGLWPQAVGEQTILFTSYRRPAAINTGRIVALSLEESKRLLRAATLLQDGAAAASVAIGIFGGLRPSEIRDLKPDDILKDKIRVSGGKMRRKLKRSVPIPPVLAEWLNEYPFKGLPKGWDYKRKAIKKATKAEKWVADILRHTSITFQTERDRDEARTAFNCGTSIEMMNRHYRDSIDSDAVVQEFWSMTPEKIRRAKLDIEMPSAKKVDWPTKTVLKKLVWEKPLVHAATDLGVSNVALKKRCVKLGIELPPRGHWLR